MAEIFQKALNMSIAAGWLILAVIALRLLLRRAPKRFRLLLWAVVGLRLALPWSIESALSLIPSAQTLPEGIMLERAPVLDTGISALNGAINPGFTTAFTPELGASANPLQVLLPIAAALWMLGAAAMLLWALVSYLSLRVRLWDSQHFEGRVYVSKRIGTAFVSGLIRPKIYLPENLSGRERECVLAHERCHIRRGDHLIKPLAYIALCLHWFNPLVWLAWILAMRDMEASCDEAAIKRLGGASRADYAQTLLNLAAGRGISLAVSLSFGDDTKRRIRAIARIRPARRWITVLAAVLSRRPSGS